MPGRRLQGQPGTGWWKDRGKLLSGLWPHCVSTSPRPPAPEPQLGVGAARAVKGPVRLKEPCTWVSEACSRAGAFCSSSLLPETSVAQSPSGLQHPALGMLSPERRRAGALPAREGRAAGASLEPVSVSSGVWLFYQAFAAVRRQPEASFWN